MAQIKKPTPKTIQQTVSLLKSGQLVAFPTETVYGLGADASNPAAVAKIFAAKGRPADHPVIVHLPAAEHLKHWAVTNNWAEKLAAAFWPGPLTMILPRAAQVSDLITGGQNTIGLRVPNHPVALTLLQAFGNGIAAPSANRFGQLSPTQAVHVQQELDGSVELILDGGECQIGLESTIIDLSGNQPNILRPGAITASQISNILDVPITQKANDTVRTSGTLDSHYAPHTPLWIVSAQSLSKTIEQLLAEKKSCAVLTSQAACLQNKQITWITMPVTASDYAHELFARLREVDNRHPAIILVTEVPNTEQWMAIRDRLKRAATRTIK